MNLRLRTLLTLFILAVIFTLVAPHTQVMAGSTSLMSPGCTDLLGIGTLSGKLVSVTNQFWVGDVVTITNVNTGGWVDFLIRPVSGADIGNSGPSPWTASSTIPGYSVYTVSVYNWAGWSLRGGTIECSKNGTPPPAGTVFPTFVYVPWNPGDSRINHNDTDRAEPVAVYCDADGIKVIHIDPITSKGTDEINVSAAEIEQAGVPGEGHITLASAEWAILSRLADGQFQVNAWYADAKPYTISWADCNPDTIAYLER